MGTPPSPSEPTSKESAEITKLLAEAAKLDAEREKTLREKQDLDSPWFRRPTGWSIVISALLAFGTIFGTLFTRDIDRRQAAAELAEAKANLAAQKAELEATRAQVDERETKVELQANQKELASLIQSNKEAKSQNNDLIAAGRKLDDRSE